jgi:DNA-binding MarR family transcriptional regulator
LQGEPPLLLDDSLLSGLTGYALQRANLRVTNDLRQALASHALTPAKVTALLLIRANPGCDQTALGRALDINRSSAMKLINLLTERGLAERRPGRDLRSNALHLTDQGRTALAEMTGIFQRSDDAMTAGLNPDERRTLLALLDRVGR